MTLEKPEPDRETTYLTARNKDGQSKTITVYGAGPEDVIELCREAIAKRAASAKGRAKQPA